MARVTTFLDWITQQISDSALCPRQPIQSPATPEPSSCLTVSGAEAGVECVFPFIVANLTISGCTRIDGDLTAWCATALDLFGNMVEGSKGRCGEDCDIGQPGELRFSIIIFFFLYLN